MEEKQDKVREAEEQLSELRSELNKLGNNSKVEKKVIRDKIKQLEEKKAFYMSREREASNRDNKKPTTDSIEETS